MTASENDADLEIGLAVRNPSETLDLPVAKDCVRREIALILREFDVSSDEPADSISGIGRKPLGSGNQSGAQGFSGDDKGRCNLSKLQKHWHNDGVIDKGAIKAVRSTPGGNTESAYW